MIDTIQNVSSLSLTRGLGGVATETLTGRSEDKAITPGMQTSQSFSEVIGGMATDAMHNLKNAEHMSFEGIKGTASTREVVDAVLAAEQSLQTAVAFRDKIVSAYLEITKMQI